MRTFYSSNVRRDKHCHRNFAVILQSFVLTKISPRTEFCWSFERIWLTVSPKGKSQKFTKYQKFVLESYRREINCESFVIFKRLLFQCFGKNRSRFREHLVRVNQELFQLEPICIALDNAINTFYPDLKTDKNQTCHRVYSWLSLQASNVMQQFMYLGFELELYSDHELIYIFWYLADFLLIWSCSLQKERLEKFSDELLPQPSQYVTVPTKEKPFFKMQRRDMVTATSSNQKKNKQQMKQMKVKEFEMATQSALLYEAQAQNLKYLQSLLSLFCGYYKSLILLKAAEKLPVSRYAGCLSHSKKDLGLKHFIRGAM